MKYIILLLLLFPAFVSAQADTSLIPMPYEVQNTKVDSQLIKVRKFKNGNIEKEWLIIKRDTVTNHEMSENWLILYNSKKKVIKSELYFFAGDK